MATPTTQWLEYDHEYSVMIVEDDPAIRRLYSFLLSNSGYNVLEAEDGQEALDLYEESPCDLIITDMNMPRMGGMDLIKALRTQGHKVHIIMVTAYGTPQTKEMAFRLGANEYIAKPFDFEELEGRIRTYFETHGGMFCDEVQEVVTLHSHLQQIYTQSDVTLVGVAIENTAQASNTLRMSDVIHIPDALLLVAIGPRTCVSLVPTLTVESTIEHMLEYFYDHPSITHSPDEIVLSFGWAHGPCDSVTELIEAAAFDLFERRQSQGITTALERPLLMLVPERLSYQQAYDRAKRLLTSYQQTLESLKTNDHHMIRQEIDRFIAVVDHDLTSGLVSFKNEVAQLLQCTELIEPSRDIVTSIYQHILLSMAWKRTIAELGSGRVPHPQHIHLASWLREYLAPMHDRLSLSLSLDIDCSVDVHISFDSQLLSVACLHLLLAVQSAGATYLRVTSAVDEADEYVTLRFDDDGSYEARQTLGHSYFLPTQTDSDSWTYQNLARASSLLQQHGVRLHMQYHNSYTQTIWMFPRAEKQHNDDQERMMTLNMLCAETQRLNQEIERMEQEIAPLKEQQHNVSQDDTVRSLVDQTQNMLKPYTKLLEHHVLAMRESAEQRIIYHDIETTKIERIRRLSNYNYLLVRNLDLALHGATLPAEYVEINDYILQVIDVLEHKLSHLQVSLHLASHFPFIWISSVEAKQVLMNLIKNAAEATQGSGTLHITTWHHHGEVVLRFKDTGCGIAPKHKESIFQLNFSTKGKGSNSGIGLYTVQSIVHRAGGKIAVASATRNDTGKLVTWKRGFRWTFRWTDTGTIFQITFPAVGDD